MADDAHVQYEVTDQRVSTEPDGRGQFHKQVRVHYKSPSGVQSHVDMPADYYTAHNVHNAIMDEMQHIEAVSGLQPGVPVPPAPPAS